MLLTVSDYFISGNYLGYAFNFLVQSLISDASCMFTQGATIVDLPVNVSLEENYQLPPEAYKSAGVKSISLL